MVCGLSLKNLVGSLSNLLFSMLALTELLACPTCRVDAGSAINLATNGAIFVMLGVMAVVFAGFLAVVVGFVRKQRALSQFQLSGAAAGVSIPPSTH